MRASKHRAPRGVLWVGLAAAWLPLAGDATLPPRRFDTVGLAQGLSNLGVNAIALDRDGFLWFGTDEGLDRWDGLSMRVFRHLPGDPESLGSNRIAALLLATDGTLWIGTRGGGVARFDPEREKFRVDRNDPANPESLAQNDVVALAEDARGRIWAATPRNGVDRLESGTDSSLRAVHFRHDDADPGSLADDRARALAFDSKGRLWVGTLGGLDRLDAESPPRFAHFRRDPADPASLSDDEVWALALDRENALWIGTWGGGADRLDDPDSDPSVAGFAHFTHDPADPRSLPDARVMKIYQDRAGTIWFGTLGESLAELTPEERDAKPARFRNHRRDRSWPQGLAGIGIHAMLEDRVGDLWIGTSTGGASRLDRRHEQSVYLRHDPADPGGLASGGVGPALEDSRGLLWLAVGDGVARLRFGAGGPEAVEISRFEPEATGPAKLPFREVYAIAEDAAGDLWFASPADGLVRLRAAEAAKPSPRFEPVANDADDPAALPTNAALSLLVDSRNRLWVGTYRGLHLLLRDAAGNPAGFRHFRHDPDDPKTLSSDRIAALAEGADGAIWVGCYHGLNRLDSETGAVERFLPDPTQPGALSYENVLALHVDAAGTLWAGTLVGGLNRFDTAQRRFEVFGVREGLPSETIGGISGGAPLWLATARGLVKFDPSTRSAVTLGVGDGLLEEELSKVSRTRDGRLLLSSGGGLTILDPRLPISNPAAAPVALTGLRRFNEPVAIGAAGSLLPRALSRLGEIVLGPRDSQFAFEFAALAFRQPERHRYRYRLEGFDAGWLASSGADRRAVYANVPPGRYRFEVTAADESGVWNETGAALAVVVKPPWWKTAWARGGAVLALAAAAFAWHRARLAHLHRTARALEVKVEERTVELAEANRRLEHASRTDLLTGLPNRRHFLARAGDEQVAQRRTRRAYSIVLGDIDHFKAINDSHGHEGGDQVLAAVGTTLRDTVRDRDTAARWGGEEFIVLLPDTDGDGATVLAEKIRQSIASLAVIAGERAVPVTMTLGFAEARVDEPLDAVIARADAALYEGKRSGRNRVVASAG